MFLDDLGNKALDIAWDKIKQKRAPRRRLAQAVLRIQESLVRCHDAYEEYKRSPKTQDEYFEAIGQLLRTLYVVKDILPVLDSQVARRLIDYAGDEVDTYQEPLPHLFATGRGFRELTDGEKKAFRLLALSWGATGEAPEFDSLLADLRRFLKENFTVDEMF